jgi:hypothetical protein
MNWSTFKIQRRALLQQLADLNLHLGIARPRPARVPPPIGWQDLEPDERAAIETYVSNLITARRAPRLLLVKPTRRRCG